MQTAIQIYGISITHVKDIGDLISVESIPGYNYCGDFFDTTLGIQYVPGMR